MKMLIAAAALAAAGAVDDRDPLAESIGELRLSSATSIVMEQRGAERQIVSVAFGRGEPKLDAILLPQMVEEIDLRSATLTEQTLELLDEFANLKRLYLPATTTDRDIARLVNLKKLEQLSLSKSRITDESLGHLRELVSLTSLDLSGTAVRSVEALSELPRLEVLNLSSTELSEQGVLGLGSLKTIRHLDVSFIPEASRKSLGEVRLVRLEVLKVSDVADAEVKFLRAHGALREVHMMRFGGERIRRFAEAGVAVRCLVLHNDILTASDASVLATELTQAELRLESARIEANALAVLQNNKEIAVTRVGLFCGKEVTASQLVPLEDLRELRVPFVSVAVMREVRARYPKLEVLEVPFSNIGDEDVKSLVGEVEVKVLDLTSSAITTECAESLLKLKELRVLRVAGTGFDGELKTMAAFSMVAELEFSLSGASSQEVARLCQQELSKVEKIRVRLR